MSDIIEHTDSGNGDAHFVRVGETNQLISAKVYQDLYHQFTGRTEQIRKRYSENLLIEFSELEQLHHKVMQLCDVHNVIARNEVISVFHEKARKEQFTSFERFQIYNSNTSSPTVNIVFKYNFSIIPSGRSQPQEYVITIRLTSRIALARQFEDDAPPFMRGRVWGYLNENVAEVTIEYADYVIARGFLEAFDEWVDGCNATPRQAWLIAIRGRSHWIPLITKLTGALLLAWFALQAAPAYFGVSFDADKAVRFIIIYAAATYIVISLMEAAGELIENAIDSYPVLSYLRLNKGDAKLIAEFQGYRRSIGWRFILGAALTVLLGIVSSKLERLV